MHETREFPYNYLIEDIMGSYGLLNTFYQPIKVKVNGDNWGNYAYGGAVFRLLF